MGKCVAGLLVLALAGVVRGQEGMDPFSFLNAPGYIGIGRDAKVGYLAEQTAGSGGMTVVTSYAVVGETDESWLVESVSPAITAMAASFPALEGVIFGLTVRKSDGVVTKAVAGRPGEPGKDVKIGPAAPMPQTTTAPEGTPEACMIELGTFDALRFENSGVVAWIGASGALKDVLLKVQGTDGYELSELPRDEELDLGGTKVQARRTRYSNGMTMWSTEDPVIVCIFGVPAGDGARRTALAKMEAESVRVDITAVKTDAKPRLKWN